EETTEKPTQEETTRKREETTEKAHRRPTTRKPEQHTEKPQEARSTRVPLGVTSKQQTEGKFHRGFCLFMLGFITIAGKGHSESSECSDSSDDDTKPGDRYPGKSGKGSKTCKDHADTPLKTAGGHASTKHVATGEPIV
ncbi:unnamed protein product, partial [Adineta steineri]